MVETLPFSKTFPSKGKVLVIGFDADIAMRSRYGKRSYFCGESQIFKPEDIPPNTQAVCLSYQVPEGRRDQIRQLLQKHRPDIPNTRISLETLRSVRARLDLILKDVALNVDPDEPGAASPLPTPPPKEPVPELTEEEIRAAF